jgi:hypothetical protein
MRPHFRNVFFKNFVYISLNIIWSAIGNWRRYTHFIHLWDYSQNLPAMRVIKYFCCTRNVCVGPEKGRSPIDAGQRRWENAVLCRSYWTLWRYLAWRSSCRESSASTLGVDCAKKQSAFGGRLGPCLQSLRECSWSRLALVDLLGLFVIQCRPVFTYSSFKLLRSSPLNASRSGCMSLTHCCSAESAQWR